MPRFKPGRGAATPFTGTGYMRRSIPGCRRSLVAGHIRVVLVHNRVGSGRREPGIQSLKRAHQPGEAGRRERGLCPALHQLGVCLHGEGSGLADGVREEHCI